MENDPAEYLKLKYSAPPEACKCGNCQLVPPAALRAWDARMASGSEDRHLMDALGILHRFALEQTGWRGWLKRWYYSDEPLRHDAANLVRRAGYEAMRPEHTKLVGEPR